MTRDLDTLLLESTWIRRLAGRLVKSADDADDISQEVLARALESCPVEQGPRLRAWLSTVTRNLVSQSGLREYRRSGVEASAARPEAVEDDSLERLALHRLLAEAIRTLSAQQREVVLLRFFDDLQPHQIAQRLGVPSATVRQRLSRALRRLREQLDHQANPENPAGGRALWCAAFADHLVPSGVPAAASLLSAVSITVMTKLFLPAAALLVLIAALWKVQSAEAPHPAPGLIEVAQSQPLAEPSREPMTDAETEASRSSLTRDEVRPAPPDSVTVHVRSETSSILTHPLAFLQSNTGSVAQIELDEDGFGTFPPSIASCRLYAGAQEHKPGWIEVLPGDEAVGLELEALIDLHGLWIENGDVPPYPVRFTAQIQEQDLGAVPLIQRALALGSIDREIQTGEGGHFSLHGLPRGAGMGVEMPTTHVLEASKNSNSGLSPDCLITIGESSLELRTIRKPSVVARVVRADDGRPVADASFTVRSISVFGRSSGESEEHTDENGIASNAIWINGVVNDHWAIMSPKERRSNADRYPSIRYEVVPVQADLLPVTAVVDLPSTGFSVDLGTIALPVVATREVRIIDVSGNGLPGAAVQVAELPAVLTDSEGIARVPADELERSGCDALAFGYRLGTLEASMIPAQEDSTSPPELVLSPGPEVHLTLPKELSGATHLRLEYTWERNPFEFLPSTDYWFEYELFEALLGYDAMLRAHFYDSRYPMAAGKGHAGFENSGTARLLSLRPGAVLFAAITEPNRFTHSKQRIEVPMTNETLHLELEYDPADQQAAPAWIMRGVVRDDVGRPVRNAKLSWRHGGYNGTNGTEFTDSDGAFEFNAILLPGKPSAISPKDPHASFQLIIEKENLYPKEILWRDEPSGPTEIVLTRSRRVEITVRDTDGRSLLASPPRYDGLLETPDAEILGVGHVLYTHFPYDTEDFVFQVGLESYTREVPEGASNLLIELPSHGHLVAEFLNLPEDLRLKGTLRTAGDSDPKSLPLEISAWGPRESYDLLPGTYEIELEGKQPRLLEIRPGETLRIDLGAY